MSWFGRDWIRSGICRLAILFRCFAGGGPLLLRTLKNIASKAVVQQDGTCSCNGEIARSLQRFLKLHGGTRGSWLRERLPSQPKCLALGRLALMNPTRSIGKFHALSGAACLDLFVNTLGSSGRVPRMAVKSPWKTGDAGKTPHSGNIYVTSMIWSLCPKCALGEMLGQHCATNRGHAALQICHLLGGGPLLAATGKLITIGNPKKRSVGMTAAWRSNGFCKKHPTSLWRRLQPMRQPLPPCSVLLAAVVVAPFSCVAIWLDLPPS